MTQLPFRRRVIIVLYILSFTISLFIFYFIMNRISITVEYTTHSRTEVDGTNIYYAQNLSKKGIIFKLSTRGNVSHIFNSQSLSDVRIQGLSAFDSKLYAVSGNFVTSDDDLSDGIVSIPTYHVVCLDKDLSLQSQTARFVINDGERISGLSAEKSGIYITTLSDDGTQARVYSLDYSLLKAPNEIPDSNIKIEAVRTKSATNGRFYADALYKNGELNLRTDADAPAGVFVVDSYVQSIVGNMRLTPIQLLSLYSLYVIWYVAILLVWFIILYLLVRVFRNRNRSFYYLLIAEAVLFVMVLGAVIAVTSGYSSARETEHSRFAALSLLGISKDAGLNETIDYDDSSFYDTDRYQRISNTLCEFVKREGNSAIFYDVFVYRVRDGIVCASSSGMNRQKLSDIYGRDMEQVTTLIQRGQQFAAVDFNIEGQDYRAVAVTRTQLNPDFALVGIINDTTLDASFFVDNMSVFILFLVFYALGSALTVLVWYLHMRDFSLLEEALSQTALGGEMPERPVIIGRDVKDMWDSASEIHKKVDEIEYSKLRTLEAYYRFAPKNVEKILVKNSVIEVQNGDGVRTSGTIGIMGIDVKGGKRIKKLDTVIGMLGEYQQEHDSIIVGKTPDMSRMQMLFANTERQTVSFNVDLYNRNTKSGGKTEFSTLLYFDQCRFGVMGNDVESTIYMDSENQALIDTISTFITEHRLELVITDTVMDRENVKTPVRFVGYAGTDAFGNMVRLYEVLDACTAVVRRERLSTLDRYNEALRLYYEKDFYIARTRFSEILRETPDDALVKYYVFESDKYLNENVEGDEHKIIR